jgi:hypothetical protein
VTGVAGLVEQAFAAIRGTPRSPFDRWTAMITPPLPLDWPDGPLVYYAYARRMRNGLVDGQEVSEPWARVERRKRLLGHHLALVPLTDELVPRTLEGVRPLTDGEQALYAEVAAAGALEDQLARARRDPAAATLVRRSYCHWRSLHAISRAVLPRHPAFVAFLDCDRITAVIEPVLPAPPEPVARPEFDRRYPRGPGRVWQMRVTDGFPLEWPATARTPIAYYAFAIRVEDAHPVPKPREVTAPWGLITRDGQAGPLRFTSLADTPVSLGIQPGRAPPPTWYPLLRSLDKDRDGMLVRTADRDTAARLRSWYQHWIDDEVLLAPVILARHPAFAAFVRG